MTLFGGQVEESEASENAIKRELKEEINLKENQIVSIKKIQENLQENGNLQIIFYIQTDANLKDLILKEGTQMAYFKKKNLFKRYFAFNIQSVLESFLKS